MACDLEEITIADCISSDGGISFSYVADGTLITAVANTANVVSNFTMSETGAWKLLEYNQDDDTAYYNQVGERTNNKHIYNQAAFMAFGGVEETKGLAIEKLKNCCRLVMIHFMNSGKKLVQGIELIEGGTAPDNWKYTKKNAKATVSIMGDTGANEDRYEITVNSQSRGASPFTSLTKTAIEAL